MRVSIRSSIRLLITLGVFFAAAVRPNPTLAAAASPSPSPVAATADAQASTDAGTIDGRISSIDYKSGLMSVEVGGTHKKTYDVVVVPGTNISGQKDFHTIADLKKGARVQVLMSRHGTTNTAQIIRLL